MGLRSDSSILQVGDAARQEIAFLAVQVAAQLAIDATLVLLCSLCDYTRLGRASRMADRRI